MHQRRVGSTEEQTPNHVGDEILKRTVSHDTRINHFTRAPLISAMQAYRFSPLSHMVLNVSRVENIEKGYVRYYIWPMPSIADADTVKSIAENEHCSHCRRCQAMFTENCTIEGIPRGRALIIQYEIPVPITRPEVIWFLLYSILIIIAIFGFQYADFQLKKSWYGYRAPPAWWETWLL